MKWLLEKEFFWEENPDVVSPVLDKLGIEYVRARKTPFDDNWDDGCDFADICVTEKNIISYGSLDFIKYVNNRTPWGDGAFLNLENMKCSTYCNHYKEDLMNFPIHFVPIGLLRDNCRYYSDSVVEGGASKVFVRPDDGDKKFTGFTAYPEDIYETMTRMSYGTLKDNWMAVISSEKIIEEEFRFFATKNEIITGCTYKRKPYERGELRHEEIPEYPQEAYDLALKIASNDWQPDLVYSVDIARQLGGYYLLEINSFASAGIYACDAEKLVKRVSELAEDKWNKENGADVI
tara:strand:+ start:7232 stop:8104 length:873 start_codon:yes stop_codon:yes gene_type:complete